MNEIFADHRFVECNNFFIALKKKKKKQGK